MSPKLRDLDDELGAAFRSADGDGPRPEAKAALMAALGVGVVAAASTATAAGAAAAGTATTAAAGGTSAVVAKGAGLAVAAKWLIASAVIVSGAVATVRVVSPPEAARTLQVAPVATATGPVAASTGKSAAPIATFPAGGALLVAPLEVAPAAVVPAPKAASAVVAAPPPFDPPAPVATAPAATAPAATAPVATAPVATAPVATAAAEPPPAGAPRNAPAVADDHARRPTVGDEIAALDRARSLLGRGHGAEALEALRDYRRAFPSGVLAQEASVLEIESLASAGQRDRARALGDRFVAEHPRSPLVPRVVRATGRSGADPGP